MNLMNSNENNIIFISFINLLLLTDFGAIDYIDLILQLTCFDIDINQCIKNSIQRNRESCRIAFSNYCPICHWQLLSSIQRLTLP